MSRNKLLYLIIVLLPTGIGCGKIDELRRANTAENPREAYESGLESTGLADSELATTWKRVALRALEYPVQAGESHRERGFVDPYTPDATGYQINLTRGQQLVAAANFLSPDSGQLFLDLFLDMESQGLGMRRVSVADSTQILKHDVTRTGRYILRLQPELLVSGEFLIQIFTTASVIFPVSGKDSGAIQSRFGAPRDGGRRRHHGVDIFAPRRTPVVAAVDGVISRVRNGGLGGKTVWLRQRSTGANFYYAHLDEQWVSRGMRVSAGDTLGLVGNTGNARTTPPHLHFGIYSNGPIDPFPFVNAPAPRFEKIQLAENRLGKWMRTSAREALIYKTPSRRSTQIAALKRHTSVRVLAASGGYFRVRLPDESTGFISQRVLESIDEPIDTRLLAKRQILQGRPTLYGSAVGNQNAGNIVLINGRFGQFIHVETTSGQQGWLLDAP